MTNSKELIEYDAATQNDVTGTATVKSDNSITITIEDGQAIIRQTSIKESAIEEIKSQPFF